MVDQARTLAYFQSVLHPNIPNAVPDATVLEAQAARDLLLSIGNFLGVITVGPSGQYPATFAGINQALVAANAAGGGHIIVAGGQGAIVYAGTPILPFSNTWLDIQPGTWLQAAASGTQCYLVQNTPNSPQGGAVTFTGTVAIGGRSGTLTGTIPSLAKDELVAIVRTSDTLTYQVMKVRSVVGTAITFYDGFAHAYTTGFTVQRIASPLQNFKFSGELRNVTNTSDEVRAINLYTTENLDISNMLCTGFDQNVLTQLAISLSYVYNTRIRNLVTVDCGTAGSGALELYGFSHLYMDNVVINADNGQPFNIQYGTDFQISESVINGLGRMLEMDTVAGFRIDGVSLECSDSVGGNCIAIESQPFGDAGAAGFVTRDGEINRCFMSNAVIALNVFDEHQKNIRVNNSHFYNNGTDISIPATNSNIFIGEECEYTTISMLTPTAYNFRWEFVATAIDVRQGGSLTSIANSYAKMMRQRGRLDFELTLTVLNGGGAVAGNIIEVGLPAVNGVVVNANATAAGAFAIIGSGEIRDSSTGVHHPVIVALSSISGRMVLLDATQALAIYQGQAGSTMAAIALAVNDIISLTGSYEPA